ncbi:hypothetical protein PI125_g13949 [Phytophthora idaei]|nr:hypothetical protein PI125_g13949 [Phytophthora idaei]KAG3146875.1 hypothetical protein PI126_g13115 [Phytophthora idaei]
MEKEDVCEGRDEWESGRLQSTGRCAVEDRTQISNAGLGPVFRLKLAFGWRSRCRPRRQPGLESAQGSRDHRQPLNATSPKTKTQKRGTQFFTM